MSRFTPLPSARPSTSRFSTLFAARKNSRAKEKEMADKRARLAVQSVATAPSTASAVAKTKSAPVKPKGKTKPVKRSASRQPSADELARKKAEDAHFEAHFKAAMAKKKARDIKAMWKRAAAKARPEFHQKRGGVDVLNANSKSEAKNLTGQAKINAHWRRVHQIMKERGL